MALTVSPVSGAHYKEANKRVRVYTITFDSSYPTGGESLTASDVGLHKIEQFIPHGGARAGAAGTTAVTVAYDHTNAKLQAFWIPALDGNAASAQAFAEVADTTDLSTYVVRVTVVGF